MSGKDKNILELANIRLRHKGGAEHEWETRVVRYRDAFGIEQRCVDHGTSWEDCSRVFVADTSWSRLECWAQAKLSADRAAHPRARDEVLALMIHTHEAVIAAEREATMPYQRARLAFVRQVFATAWACLPEDSQAMVEGLHEVGEILRDLPCGIDLAREGKR